MQTIVDKIFLLVPLVRMETMAPVLGALVQAPPPPVLGGSCEPPSPPKAQL